MYGLEADDLVVKYYDQAFGISAEAELAWYLNKARRYGSPVLDLACGTGRLALMLAEEGFDVFGIDQSEGMLSQFKKKLEQAPPQVKSRISIDQQKMSDFDLGRKFNTIICCDAFFHNLNVEEQLDTLSTVHRHLAAGGHFLFNLPHPNCEFIQKSVDDGGQTFALRGKFDLKGGLGTLLVEQAQAGNALDQTITTTLRLTRYASDGKIIEKGESTWRTRYLFKYEAIHILYRCGFVIDSLVGDYKDGPVAERSQLIFDVSLGEAKA